MTGIDILMICGSLRTGSTNEALLRTAAAVVPGGVTARRYQGLSDLPHFNPDDDREPLHPAVADLRATVGSADAVLVCTPEYAGSLPGSFKNLLDWTIGGGELYGKPVAWINVSASTTEAAGAHATLRTVLGYAGTAVVDAACAHLPVTRDAVGPDGLLSEPALRAELTAAVTALADHVTAARART